jgi:hypothetical protein
MPPVERSVLSGASPYHHSITPLQRNEIFVDVRFEEVVLRCQAAERYIAVRTNQIKNRGSTVLRKLTVDVNQHLDAGMAWMSLRDKRPGARQASGEFVIFPLWRRSAPSSKCFSVRHTARKKESLAS